MQRLVTHRYSFVLYFPVLFSRAEIEVLRTRLENKPKQMERSAEDTLSRITRLREQVREERAKRITADEVIFEEIVRRTSAMKRAMIAMASDGDTSTVSSGTKK